MRPPHPWPRCIANAALHRQRPLACPLQVVFANSFVGWAVGGDPNGNNGCILYTVNGGKTWTEQLPANLPLVRMYQTCNGNGGSVGTNTFACQTPTTDPGVLANTGPSYAVQTSSLAFYSGSYVGLGDATNAVYVPQFNCDGNRKNNSIWYTMSPQLCYAVGKLSYADNLGGGLNGLAGLNGLTGTPGLNATYYYPAFPNLLSVSATANGRYAYAVSALGNPSVLLSSQAYNGTNVTATAVTIPFTNITMNVNFTCDNTTFSNATGTPTYGACYNTTLQLTQVRVNATLLPFGGPGPVWYLANVTNNYTLPVDPNTLAPPLKPVIMQYAAATGWAPLNYSVQYCSLGPCFNLSMSTFPSLLELAVDLVSVSVISRNSVVAAGANFLLFSASANSQFNQHGLGPTAVFTLTYPLGPQVDFLLQSIIASAAFNASLAGKTLAGPNGLAGPQYFVDLLGEHVAGVGNLTGQGNYSQTGVPGGNYTTNYTANWVR